MAILFRRRFRFGTMAEWPESVNYLHTDVVVVAVAVAVAVAVGLIRALRNSCNRHINVTKNTPLSFEVIGLGSQTQWPINKTWSSKVLSLFCALKSKMM